MNKIELTNKINILYKKAENTYGPNFKALVAQIAALEVIRDSIQG